MFVLTTSAVGAQSVEQSQLQACTVLATAELKLACFEMVTAAAATKVQEESIPSATTSQDIVAVEETTQLVKSDAVITSGAVGIVAEEIEIKPEPVEATPAVVTQDKADEDFGAEYLDRPQEKAEEEEEGVFTATVIDVKKTRSRKLIFYFSNDHIWQQMENGYMQYPKDEEFTVEITRGLMGDYQLRVNGKGRMTRIIRVK